MIRYLHLHHGEDVAVSLFKNEAEILILLPAGSKLPVSRPMSRLCGIEFNMSAKGSLENAH